MRSWKQTGAAVWASLVTVWLVILGLAVLPGLIEVMAEDGTDFVDRVAGFWFVVMVMVVPGWVWFKLTSPLRRRESATDSTIEGEA